MKDLVLPSEKATLRAAKQKAIEDARQEAATSLRRDMGMTFGTDHGQRVLRWLRDQCCFGKPILGAVAGKLDPEVTLYNAMRLNLYLEVRKNLPFNILKEVEYDG